MKILFYNAFVYTGQEKYTIHALVVENGVITELFEAKPFLTDVKEINLDGKYVYPGFTDTHTHSFEGGLYSLCADTYNCSTISEALDVLSQVEPVGGMVFGWRFDENRITEKRFPTLSELDKLYPDIPIILRRIDGHSAVINSCAMKRIGRDIKHENGLVRKEYNDVAAHWFHRNISENGVFAAYAKAAEIALRGGFTCIHTMAGDADYDLLTYPVLKNNLNRFPVEFVPYPQMFDIDKAVNFESGRIGGCILADGSFGSYTAALNSPYSNTDIRGILYQTDEFWEKFVAQAHERNLQIAVHAIGDRATEQIINAVEKAQLKKEKDLRHELIHNELITDRNIDRMKKLGMSAVMQPMFDRLWGGRNQFYSRVLGVERAWKTNRFKTIYDKGVLLTGGSDWYITELDVIQQLYAVTHTHNPAQSLSASEAIKIYTENAAKLNFEEDKKGKIAVGYIADFSVADSDLLDVDRIREASITDVIRSGKIEYHAE